MPALGTTYWLEGEVVWSCQTLSWHWKLIGTNVEPTVVAAPAPAGTTNATVTAATRDASKHRTACLLSTLLRPSVVVLDPTILAQDKQVQ